MRSTDKYVVYGPGDTLRRMMPALLKEHDPKYQYQHNSADDKEIITIAVYEEYQKQINASVTVTLVADFNPKRLRIEITTTGGRMGFRGSSLNVEQSIYESLTDFILDFTKRFGLTLQEVEQEESSETKS